ncbi:MAG: hypothetical protein ABUS79_10155 [Pseudomonadota bacterium]
MPQIGLDGQERIAAATVVVAGDDVTCEVIVRALAAAGVGTLRMIRRGGPLPGHVGDALRASNPDVRVETCPWPSQDDVTAHPDPGAAWLAALRGAAIILRSGFDDDPMLRAAVRLGIPAIVARGRAGRVDVLSFRRHGPCPHAALDVPAQAAKVDDDDGGAGAVIAAHIAATEALAALAGATTGTARARHVVVALHGADGDRGGAAERTRATDIPWAPECFACGGAASEMTFS